MIRVTLEVDDAGARGFVVDLGTAVSERDALNQALGMRLAEELQAHFRARAGEPNRMGAKKTGFWAEVAGATKLEEWDKNGATVAIADERVRVHVYGGTIRPVKGKFLTIPLVPEARGKRVASYERETGNELFRVGRVLAIKSAGGGDRSTVAAATGRRYRKGKTTSIPLAAKQELLAVYALAEKVTIKKDAMALPEEIKLARALKEEAEDWLETEGGLV